MGLSTHFHYLLTPSLTIKFVSKLMNQLRPFYLRIHFNSFDMLESSVCVFVLLTLCVCICAVGRY